MLSLLLLPLQRINKIRPFITQLMDLLALTHACTQSIPLSSPPSSILSNKQLSHQQAAAKEEKHHVREDNAVAEIVLRLVFCAVDVGGDDSIQITLYDCKLVFVKNKCGYELTQPITKPIMTPLLKTPSVLLLAC